jgi:uncharacterized phage protein (TIGR02220 family)
MLAESALFRLRQHTEEAALSNRRHPGIPSKRFAKLWETAWCHPKIRRALRTDTTAAALWYQGLSYCVAVRSDGVIPRDQVTTLIHVNPQRLPYAVKVLLDLQLWEIGTDVEGNEIYLVHDWGQWQEKVAVLDEKSNQARDAANARWEKQRQARCQQEETSIRPDPDQGPTKGRPDPLPDPLPDRWVNHANCRTTLKPVHAPCNAFCNADSNASKSKSESEVRVKRIPDSATPTHSPNNITTLPQSQASVLTDEEIEVKARQWLQSFCSDTGKSFPSNRHVVAPIMDRIREGATGEQASSAVTYCLRHWADNPEMRGYLRPSTVFGPKFWEYAAAGKDVVPETGMSVFERMFRA